MPDKRLIRRLFNLFGWMLNGLKAISLLLLLTPLFLTWQTYSPRRAASGLRPARVQYDTALGAEPINTSFTRPSIDGRGQYISRVSAENGNLNYYDEDNHVRQQYPLDSLRRVLQSPLNQLPADLRQRILTDRNRQTRQIDSMLRADPDVRIIRLPDRWVRQPTSGSGVAWRIKVPIWGQSVFNPRIGSYTNLTDWNRLASERPYAEIRPHLDLNATFELTVSIHRWSDLTFPVWVMAILSLITTLLWFLLPGVILHWLREIFRGLLNDAYFAPAITIRMQRIGQAFVGTFVAQNLLVTLNSYAARTYLDDRYFYSSNNLPYVSLDHWLWLFIGLVTLVLAQIFHYGSLLQREQDLTI
jgi:hypothetical protein